MQYTVPYTSHYCAGCTTLHFVMQYVVQYAGHYCARCTTINCNADFALQYTLQALHSRVYFPSLGPKATCNHCSFVQSLKSNSSYHSTLSSIFSRRPSAHISGQLSTLPSSPCSSIGLVACIKLGGAKSQSTFLSVLSVSREPCPIPGRSAPAI